MDHSTESPNFLQFANLVDAETSHDEVMERDELMLLRAVFHVKSTRAQRKLYQSVKSAVELDAKNKVPHSWLTYRRCSIKHSYRKPVFLRRPQLMSSHISQVSFVLLSVSRRTLIVSLRIVHIVHPGRIASNSRTVSESIESGRTAHRW